jgi:hypothetical protein
MAICRPASQLNNEDLPTFGRPTMATFGNGMDGSRLMVSEGLVASPASCGPGYFV